MPAVNPQSPNPSGPRGPGGFLYFAGKRWEDSLMLPYAKVMTPGLGTESLVEQKVSSFYISKPETYIYKPDT